MLNYLAWTMRTARRYLWSVEALVLVAFLFLAYQYVVHGESLRTLVRKAKVKVRVLSRIRQ